ncbi:hypothetical protein ElyMa_002003900 [Elysia marginata]|uniref:Uncharacterized protein n=1 Tax=Elysia marginata TaxID=1093978 RepID=A0AAV4F2N0_9GAST|nr:hypothetical protein ElyMa_002003900 [Elysia marginata]
MENNATAHAGGRHSTRATSTVTETESLLSKLGQGYKRAKAQQILRLLADQESLNQRFKDCALNEDEDDDECDSNGKTCEKTRKGSNDARSNSPIGGVWVKRGLTSTLPTEEEKRERRLTEIEKEQRVEGYLGGSKIKASDTPVSKPKQKKKVSSAVDPSRCRTSMGFYNAAECATSVDGHPELDVEGAANADLELAMGAEADTENQSPRYLNEENDFILSAVGARARLTPRGGPKQRRLFRQQITQGVTSTVTDTIPEESVGIQSARSSSTRPKTGIVGGSARSKQYRRPSRPNPSRDEFENSGNAIHQRGFGQPEYTPTSILSNITTTSTTVSKLDPPFTPRGGGVGGIGVRGFCEGPQTPRVSIRDDAIFIPITPRGGTNSMTPRPEASYGHGSTPTHRHSNEPISALITPRQQQDYSSNVMPRGINGHVAQDHTTPSNTPRETVAGSGKGLHTPRHGGGVGSVGYSSRTNESKSILNLRPNKSLSFRTNDMTNSQSRKDPSFSPRRNELALALTPRQKDQNGVAVTPRNEYSSGLFEMSLTPRNDNSPTNPLKTPRRGDDGGITVTSGVVVTPRSYNMTSSGQWAARPGASGTGATTSTSNTNEEKLKQPKLLEQTTLDLNSPRATYPIPEYIKSEGWSSTCTTGIGINTEMISPRKSDSSGQNIVDSQRSPRHVSRAVLSVGKNPSHVACVSQRYSKSNRAGQSELEMTTPRRQRVVAAAVAASEKTAATAASAVMTPRGCGDLHRVPVNGNLSHRSERMQPMTVMKLPPLDAAIHKPVVS